MKYQSSMACFVAILTLMASAAKALPAPAQGPDGAYLDCPCIQSGFKVDAYGFSKCAAWDENSTACKSASPPDWCEHKWCYINPFNCARRNGRMQNMTYSYEACGWIDRYTPIKRWDSSRPIYAYAFGFKAELRPESGQTNLDMMLHFAYKMLPYAGIDPSSVLYRELSNASRSQHFSPYDGCPYDAALGNIHLCFGDIWDIRKRHILSREVSFVHVAGDQFKMIGPAAEKAKPNEPWDTIAKPFEPFSWNLWGLIVAVILATSIAMLLFEFHRLEGDFEGSSVGASILKAIYVSFTSFVNGGAAYSPVTMSGRIVAVGFGLFVLISISAFTASTADFLISRSLARSINSLDDALSARHKVCYPSGIEALLETRYPLMRSMGLPVVAYDGAPIVEAIANQTCDYALVSSGWMTPYWDKGEQCSLVFIGPSILEMPMGFYVNSELRSLITAAVADSRMRGAWAEVENAFQSIGICSTGRRLRATGSSANAVVGKLSGESASGPQRLEASHMYGACCVVLFCFMLALCVRVVELVVFGCSQEDKELMDGVKKDIKALEKGELHVLSNSHYDRTGAQGPDTDVQKSVQDTTDLPKESDHQGESFQVDRGTNREHEEMLQRLENMEQRLLQRLEDTVSREGRSFYMSHLAI